MVKCKQNRVRLVITTVSTPQKSSSESFQECRDVERISVLDLKALIVKRVGMQRANRYFVHFVRFLGSHLSKVELDKLVIATIGKKNVPLHNQLVRAILSNAVKGKAPPPLPPFPPENFEKFSSKHQSPSVTSNRQHTSPSTVSNGDSFLSSPRSVRSTAHHYRDKDYRVSPLGNSEAHSGSNLFQLIPQPEDVAKHLDAESNSLRKPPAKPARIDYSVSDDSAGVIESEVLGGEEVFSYNEDRAEVLSLGNSIRGSVGFLSQLSSEISSNRPTLCAFPAHFLTQDGLENGFFGSNNLPDGDAMHCLIEQAATREGLQGVSKGCADVLNFALDAYLKGLIESCVSNCAGLVSTFQDCTLLDKNVNGGGSMNLGHGVKQNCSQPTVDPVRLQRRQSSISLMNFKAAMDMNPQQLGGNWSVQLEKILLRVFYQ